MFTDAVIYHKPGAINIAEIPPLPSSNGILSTPAMWRGQFYRAQGNNPKPFRRLRLWLAHEIAYLEQSYPSRTAAAEIAAQLGRSIGAIRSKARALGLRRPRKGEDVAEPSFQAVAPLPDVKVLLPKTPSGRASWTDDAVRNLAGLWKRLLAPKVIAEILQIRPGAVSEAAHRVGLPSRIGLSLINAVPAGDPFALPENHVVASQMVECLCLTNGRLFYVHPDNKRKEHVSKEGRKTIERRQSSGFAYA